MGDQTLAWRNDLVHLREALDRLCRTLPSASAWIVLIEFKIPRWERRIDVILLAGDHIILLEQKTHAPTNEDCLQAEEYALLLHYFHATSDRRRIVPLVVSSVASRVAPTHQAELPFLETARYWIEPVERETWEGLPARLARLSINPSLAIDVDRWEYGAYHPVPTIIDAVLSLRSGLSVGDIAQSGAARHDVERLTRFIQTRVTEAREAQRHVVCFITGVPGSGKTLVGLNLAFSKQTEGDSIHFMSGNGPLVKVLQTVLTRHQMRKGLRALDARMHARTLIENVHVFARTYTNEDKSAPSNHVIIFDEAQRAWNKAQNLAKFKRPYSEPEMLLEIMERHQDWSVVIALVGGGQEINNGEAGLEEWGRSLAAAKGRQWLVYASPEAIDGGASVAGSRLRSETNAFLQIVPEPQLHLDVSVRSLKADSYAKWVNCVIAGDAAGAAQFKDSLQFPIFLTRDLGTMRNLLRANTIGLSRAGLVASSQAARLRAEGLEPDSAFHGGYPWEHWYLGEPNDVRSSMQLEVFATEFEIQGLELDWIGMCWGGDFIWSAKASAWMLRAFRAGNSRWSEIKSEDRRLFRKNAYRVLLTRARQGIVLYVPAGDVGDATRKPVNFQETADFLLSCGARLVTGKMQTQDIANSLARNGLFH